MQTFRKLSRDKIEEIQLSVADFLYKSKVNIAIEDAIKKQTFKDFESETYDAFQKQFTPFTKEKTIQNIIDSVSKIDDRDLTLAVVSSLILFSDAFSSGEKGILLYLIWSANIGGKSAMTLLNASNASFSASESTIGSLVSPRVSYLIQELDKTSAEWIAGQIASGLKANLTPKDIAQAIGDQIESLSSRRAGIVAETELANMIGQVTLKVFEMNGVSTVRWVTARDERTCPICEGNEKDGAIEIGKNFSSGVNAAPAHVGCRCFTTTDDDVKVSWRG